MCIFIWCQDNCGMQYWWTLGKLAFYNSIYMLDKGSATWGLLNPTHPTVTVLMELKKTTVMTTNPGQNGSRLWDIEQQLVLWAAAYHRQDVEPCQAASYHEQSANSMTYLTTDQAILFIHHTFNWNVDSITKQVLLSCAKVDGIEGSYWLISQLTVSRQPTFLDHIALITRGCHSCRH